jgi:cofilin
MQSRSSGIAITPECSTKYNELKQKKLTFIIFRLNSTATEVVVETDSSEVEAKTYDDFLTLLPENDCRWAVYNLEYSFGAEEGSRSSILFYFW